MAKRGNHSERSDAKQNSRRRDYSQPEIKWAIGNESLDILSESTPQQFVLSSVDAKTAKPISLIQDNEKAKKDHSLIQDSKAATRLANAEYEPQRTKSASLFASADSRDPQIPLEKRENRIGDSVDTRDQSVGTQSTDRYSADIRPIETQRIDTQPLGTGAQVTPGSEEQKPVDPRISIYAPGARSNTSGVGPVDANSGGPIPRIEPEIDGDSPPARGAHSANGNYRDGSYDSGILSPYLGQSGRRRADSVRQQLDKALDEWWEYSVLLPTALLRDGLLVLEAGHSLDEVHRTLILRSSLAKRKGMVTAVQHQLDPDRAAFLLKDALLDDQHPLATEDVRYLLADGEPNPEWAELLLDELRYDYPQLSGRKKSIAQGTISILQDFVGTAASTHLNSDAIYDVAVKGTKPLAIIEADVTTKAVPIELSVPSYWNVGRIILVLLLFATLITTWFWFQGRTTLTDMVNVPAGAYEVGHELGGSGERSITLDRGYAIDRTEVTNASYRLCYEQGICDAPTDIQSSTRQSYFLDPTFSDYPVISVDWGRASQYCEWAGKRLPTEEEWEIAATNAPATNRHFTFPWGDRFNRLYANGVVSNFGDTQPTGSYYPVGTSSLGAEDMAGNVAEWTSTRRSDGVYDSYVTKGGSYLDDAEGLWPSRSVTQPANFSAAWLGFRCAKALPDAP